MSRMNMLFDKKHSPCNSDQLSVEEFCLQSVATGDLDDLSCKHAGVFTCKE